MLHDKAAARLRAMMATIGVEDPPQEQVDPWILRLARWEREKQALAKLSPEVRAVLDAEVA